MVDRGDLAAEIGEHKLFSAINSISNVTKNNGKSLIIATENLESMIFRKNSKYPIWYFSRFWPFTCCKNIQ